MVTAHQCVANFPFQIYMLNLLEKDAVTQIVGDGIGQVIPF